MRLVGTFGKVNRGEVIRLIESTYNLVNGWINPCNPSVDLIISSQTTKLLHPTWYKKVAAIAHWNAIEVDPDFFCDRSLGVQCKLYGKFNADAADNLLATYIIDVVVHELSHLQQNMKFYAENSALTLEKTFEWVEQSNEFNTRLFIDEYHKEIEQALRLKLDFRVVQSNMTHYRKPLDDLYVGIKSYEDIVNSVFCYLTSCEANKVLTYYNSALAMNLDTVKIVFDNVLYDLSNPNAIGELDKKVRYSFSEFNATTPVVRKINGKPVCIAVLRKIGELEPNISQTFKVNFNQPA